MKRANLAISVIVLTVLMLGFQNCGQLTGPSALQMGTILNGTSTGNPSPKFNFLYVSNKVFKPNCVQCHNADSDINYSTYDSTLLTGQLASLEAHYRVYEEPNKKCGAIPAEDMDLVANWIRAGAPQ